MDKMLGLYIHIPFCKSKCAYCDFYSLARSESRMDAYAAALSASLREAAPQASGYTVDTVYFGGGTPSFLGAARLAALLQTALDGFAAASDAEVTFEANPESARDVSALRTLRGAGFNRISLGMQSADDEREQRILDD
ncbi:MAG: radical SAM protein, partial [Oscillospiraceae bacterium]|nr:radical SAM protein [Oscillospiraceae bacterium]